MSLQKDAIQLSSVLNEILNSANGSRSAYISKLAERIAPLIVRFDRAVFDMHSREEASDALSEMAEGMSALSAAATKGELHAFPGRSLDSYWRLYTIFQESKYRDQEL